MKIKTMYERVKELLIKDNNNPYKYRDNDNALVVRIWWDEVIAKGFAPEQLTITEFFILYRDEKITSADTITRARRKVQEENEHLRGNSYIDRQNKQEEVKDEIKILGETNIIQQSLSFEQYKQNISR